MKWSIVVFICVILSSYFYIERIKSDVIKLEAKNVELKADKKSLEDKLIISNNSIETLQRDIQLQNAAINKLKEESSIKEKKNEIAIKNATEVAETYKNKANIILHEPKPADTSECDAANLLINKEIKNALK